MEHRHYSFGASDGKAIHVRRYGPATPAPRASLVVSHGMAEHGGRYPHLARTCSKRGFDVVIPDHRGHGRTDTGAARGVLAERSGFDRVVEDLRELVLDAAGSGGLPVFLFGHSFGALAALAFAEKHGTLLTGCALSAPPAPQAPALDLAGRVVIALGMRFRGPRAPARLVRSMTFGAYARTIAGASTDCDWLSRDPGTVRAYREDPACNFTCTYSFYRDLASGLRATYDPARLSAIPRDLPLYHFCGGADPVVGGASGFERQTARLESLGLGDFTSRMYPDARHETLNDVGSDRVLADLVEWMESRIRS